MEEFPNTEFIYLIQPREFIRMKENVYKIGRTAQSPDKRIGQYPKNTRLHLLVSVDNSVETETVLLRLFRRSFTARTDYGSEYFEGDVNDMIDLITRNIKAPDSLQKCDYCRLSIMSNTSASVFCCGVYHHACINRTQVPVCPGCNKRYPRELLYLSDTRLLDLFEPSQHCSLVDTVEEATVCAILGDRERSDAILDCLMSGKPTYLFIDPAMAPNQVAQFKHISELCMTSVTRVPNVHSYLCFRPKHVRTPMLELSDTLTVLNYPDAVKWEDVIYSRMSVVSNSCDYTLLPSYSQLESALYTLANSLVEAT